MGYRVYYEEMISFVHQVNELCNKWMECLQSVSNSEQNLQNTKYAKGQLADKMKQYLDEVHYQTLLPGLMNAVQALNVTLGAYFGGYLENVDGGNGSNSKTGNYCYNTFLADELEDQGIVSNRFTSMMIRAEDYHDTVTRIRNSVSDLVSLTPSRGEAFVEAIDKARQLALLTDQKVRSYEANHAGDLDNFDALVAELRCVIAKQLSNKRVPVMSYTGGAVVTMCDYSKLHEAENAVHDDMQKMESAYIKGVNAFSEMQAYKDYEAYEAREKEAKWVKIGVGIVAGIGMVALTVCTGGVAAVVGCAFIGGVAGAIKSTADVYVEKGSGTSFWGNITSGDFYSKWDAKDILSVSVGTLKGGVEGAFFALSAGNGMGSVLQQPIKKAMKKTALTAGETALTSFLDMGKDVGIAIIDKKPGKEIRSIICNDGLGLVKNTMVSSAGAFASSYLDGLSNVEIGEQKYLKKLGNNVVSSFGKTTIEHVISTGFDLTGAVLDNDSSTTARSVLREGFNEYKKEMAKEIVGDVVDTTFGQIDKKIDIENKVGKYSKQAGIGMVKNMTNSFTDNVVVQYFDNDDVDLGKALDETVDEGRGILKGAGDSVKETLKDNLDTFEMKMKRESNSNGRVNIVTFGDGNKGVLKKDYDEALQNAGTGAYKNMTAQEMLGLSSDVDVKKDAHYKTVNYQNLTKTKSSDGTKLKNKSNVTSVTYNNPKKKK